MDRSAIEIGPPPRQAGEGPRCTMILRKRNRDPLRFGTEPGRDTLGSDSI